MLFQQVRSLLIMDSVKSHLENVIELLKRYNKEYKIIDGDVIPFLQFMDTDLNKPFKHILRQKLADHFGNGTEEFTKEGNCRRVLC